MGRKLLFLCLALMLLDCRAQGDVLVFSKTTAYRHASIETGIHTIEALVGDRLRIDHTEDASRPRSRTPAA